MTNNLSEKRSNIGIVAALVSAFIFSLAALVTGLVLGIQNNIGSGRAKRGIDTPHYLLADSAESLNHTLSSMRLCNEKDAARELSDSALVYAVRAETALECENFDWLSERDSEEFLNDLTALLRSADADSLEYADAAYEYSKAFLKHVKDGADFKYDGGLAESGDKANEKAPESKSKNSTDGSGESKADAEQKADAEKLLKKTLKADKTEFTGSYGDRLEYSVERDGVIGYAVTQGDKITEFAFSHGGSSSEKNDVSKEDAQRIATECAKACGFDGLKLFNTEINGDTATVKLCKAFKGAMACDECASVIVSGGKAVAFTSGKSDCKHEVPDVKVTEETARRSAPDGARATGVLVTRKVNGKERVCYEYIYDLDDGVHYVYVCAENGKQMQVK